ncbi:MAG TPA: NAC domain-containing protein, partial [Thermoplasmata archaeon]|nr:NAC domain-containing protein [Thermoplasmata archaeon]
MVPGGRMNPKQMKQMMKRLGIEQEEIAGVEEVV